MREVWECHFCGCDKADPSPTCTAEDGDGHLFMKSLVEEGVDWEGLRRRYKEMPSQEWFKKNYVNKPLGIDLGGSDA